MEAQPVRRRHFQSIMGNLGIRCRRTVEQARADNEMNLNLGNLALRSLLWRHWPFSQ